MHPTIQPPQTPGQTAAGSGGQAGGLRVPRAEGITLHGIATLHGMLRNMQSILADRARINRELVETDQKVVEALEGLIDYLKID